MLKSFVKSNREESRERKRNLDDFISQSLHHNMHVVRIINTKWSETSHSAYVMVKCSDNRVYELAISNHPRKSHLHPLNEIVGETMSTYELWQGLNQAGITIPDIRVVSPDNYYGVNESIPYRINPKALVGRAASHLAFMTDCYWVQDALLLDDKQVLAITYTNAGHTRSAHALYMNYDPIGQGCSMRDIAVIQYLKHNFDIKTARRIYYQDEYVLNTVEEYWDEISTTSTFHHTPSIMNNHQYSNACQASKTSDGIDNNHDVFESSGTEYVLWLKSNNPQHVHD